jgi:hypothetical protein
MRLLYLIQEAHMSALLKAFFKKMTNLGYHFKKLLSISFKEIGIIIGTSICALILSELFKNFILFNNTHSERWQAPYFFTFPVI